MPRARSAINAFTAAEVSAITGLSLPMIDYVRREDLLRPAYAGAGHARGKVRYYSYRDLVVGRLIQRYRMAGVQLSRMKFAVDRLRADSFWKDSDDPADGLDYVVSDGGSVEIRDYASLIDAIGQDRSQAFSLIVNIRNLREEVRALLPDPKRQAFSMRVRSLRYEKPPRMVGPNDG